MYKRQGKRAEGQESRDSRSSDPGRQELLPERSLMGESMEKSPVLDWSMEELWRRIGERQHQTFYTAKGLPFTYEIRGGEMVVDRRMKTITRATMSRALKRIQENPAAITGPKSLNLFGAPYILAVLRALQDENS